MSILKELNTSRPDAPSLPFLDSLALPVGLYPTTPEKAAGILEDPAESDARPKAEHLVATAAA
jgi:hypothetical protein